MKELAWLVFGGALVLLASPLRTLWARDDAPWVAPFGLWAVITVAAALALRPPRQRP